jgi:hypothetical protein
MTPYMPLEDTHRKALKRAFLGRGSGPSGLDEEDPTIVVMATMTADEHGGIGKIPSR